MPLPTKCADNGHCHRSKSTKALMASKISLNSFFHVSVVISYILYLPREMEEEAQNMQGTTL